MTKTLTIVCPECYGIVEQDWDLDLTDRVEAIAVLIDEAKEMEAGECWRSAKTCRWREAREGEVICC